jgi:hypothetical protein
LGRDPTHSSQPSPNLLPPPHSPMCLTAHVHLFAIKSQFWEKTPQMQAPGLWIFHCVFIFVWFGSVCILLPFQVLRLAYPRCRSVYIWIWDEQTSIQYVGEEEDEVLSRRRRNSGGLVRNLMQLRVHARLVWFGFSGQLASRESIPVS